RIEMERIQNSCLVSRRSRTETAHSERRLASLRSGEQGAIHCGMGGWTPGANGEAKENRG
ncbi:MAG: hypothetical protein KDJ23_14890, partial [Rhodoblastus sp.]|nr:hypothetical protein [Rhodoblastus sp.]